MAIPTQTITGPLLVGNEVSHGPITGTDSVLTLPFLSYAGTGRVASLEGIEFPVEHVLMHFSQDIVEHKYPNIPGASVESMGRNAHHFSVRAIFLDNLFNAKWVDLFPKTFQSVMRLLNDSANDRIKFQHPTLGKFNVKVIHGQTEAVYSCRNGQIIEFELIEDGNSDAHPQDNILGNDEVGNAPIVAGNVDTGATNFISALPSNESVPFTLPSVPFGTQVNQSLQPFRQTTVGIGTAIGGASDTIASLSTFEASLIALNDPNTSYMQVNCERAISGLNDAITSNRSSLQIYNVQTDMTLNMVVLAIQRARSGTSVASITIESLINVNPQLDPNALLETGSIVYYV